MKNQRVVVSRFGGPECLRVVEEDLPRPAAGEVRVHVLSAGVSFADLLMREGVHPERQRPPFTLGWDIVGRVDAVGAGAHDVQEGDTVAALTITGGYSRYLCLPANDVVPVPAGVSPALAVCLVMDYVGGTSLCARNSSEEISLVVAAAKIILPLVRLEALISCWGMIIYMCIQAAETKD